jgi:hypothetical protein
MSFEELLKFVDMLPVQYRAKVYRMALENLHGEAMSELAIYATDIENFTRIAYNEFHAEAERDLEQHMTKLLRALHSVKGGQS